MSIKHFTQVLLVSLALTSVVAAESMFSDIPKDKAAPSIEPGEFGGLATYSRMIRDGEVDVGDRYGMDQNRGRFHRIHSEELDVTCDSCHVGDKYAPDFLVLNRANAERKAAGVGKGKEIGVVDRSMCLGCHTSGGVATKWYKAAGQ